MRGAKKTFFLLLMTISTLLSGQTLHLNQLAFFEGDEIEGVAYFSNQGLLNHTYSLNVYSENGAVLSQALFFVNRTAMSFSMQIPENAKSGYYSLQIANYHNSVVTHIKNILILNEEDWDKVKVSTGTSDRKIANAPKSNLKLSISQNDTSASIHLIPSDIIKSSIKNVSVSVRDLAQNPLSLDKEITSLSEPPCNLGNQHIISDRGLQDWLYGYTIEGFVYDLENNPLPNYPVVLSNTKNELTFNYTRSNNEGKFGFYNINESGNFEAYLQSLDPDVTKQSKITYKMPLEGVGRNPLMCKEKFFLDSAQIAQMVRIRSLYEKVKNAYSPSELKKVWVPAEPKPLLNYKDHLVTMDEYVSLTTTKEVFKEIVPHAFLAQNRLRVFSPKLKKTLSKHPLLLINGIPTRDDEILNLPPEEIKYIEIVYEVTQLASYGSFALGGIISVITKNNFEYGPYLNKMRIDGFIEKSKIIYPQKDAFEPFFPSVLYWNPGLESNNGSYEFDLYKPAHTTEVLVSTIFQLTNGTIISHEEITTLENANK
jgi:hypothetical protein